MMENQNIKILVADDHTLVRQGIIRLLQDHKGFVVVAEAENGEDLVEKYFKFFPDLMLVDIAMPVKNGIQAIEEIQKIAPKAKALFLSMNEGPEYVYKVLKSGGMGLLNKNILDGELALAIKKVCSGEKYFGSKWDEKSLKKLLEDYEAEKEIETGKNKIELNYREEQILKLIVSGATSKEIAEEVDVSKKTVDYYRANIIKKTEAKSQVDLIKFGLEYFEKKNKPGI